MTYNNKTVSTPGSPLVPATAAGESDWTKFSPPLDVRFTVSNLSSHGPTTDLVAALSNTPIPDANNAPVYPDEAFKIVVSDITDALPYIIAPISYEP